MKRELFDWLSRVANISSAYEIFNSLRFMSEHDQADALAVMPQPMRNKLEHARYVFEERKNSALFAALEEINIDPIDRQGLIANLQQSSDLAAMPNEMILEIAKDMKPIDILALAHTDKRLQDIVLGSPSLAHTHAMAVHGQAAWRLLRDEELGNPDAGLDGLDQLWDYLTAAQQRRCIAHIGHLTDQQNRSFALARLAPFLTPEHQSTAFEIVRNIPPGWRASPLAALAPTLAPEHQGTALEIARSLGPHDMADLIIKLGPTLAPEHQGTALEIAQTFALDGWTKAKLLAALARTLAPEHHNAAGALVQTIFSPGPRAIVIAAYQPEDRPTALDTARDITDERMRASTLATMAPFLATEHQGTALEISRNINGEAYRASALAGLAPFLATEHQGAALEISRNINGEAHRASALVGLAPFLTAEHQGTALEISRNINIAGARARILAKLGPTLAPENQAAALAIVQDFTEEWVRVISLKGLVPTLALQHRGTALELIALELIGNIGHPQIRASLLSTMGPEHWNDALQIAQEGINPRDRASAFREILPQTAR